MKFPGNMNLGWVLFLMGLLLGFQCLEAATFLGESSNTRDTSSSHSSHTPYDSSSDDDDDDKGWSLSGIFGFFKKDQSEKVYTEEVQPAITYESDDEVNPWEDLEEELAYGTPTNWVPGRLRTSFEVGLQHWEPFSRSGQYVADYDIDPVTVTTFDASVRVKGWVVMVDYKTSLTDPGNMKNLLAQVSRINPGEGLWWSLYAEKGDIEGTAQTEDEFGNPVEYPVDTEWNRIGIELRTYYGLFAGLVWEDLTMPVIHTFNNEEIAFAVFDDKTRARTLSLAVGYDKARYLLNDFKEGGAFAWSLEGAVGAGWLSYSEDESQAFIESQGYEFESVNFLIAGSLDGRVGYTYSKEILNTDVQLYAGLRCRASGWMNTAGNPPDLDTVELETGFGLIQAGVFGRISFQW